MSYFLKIVAIPVMAVLIASQAMADEPSNADLVSLKAETVQLVLGVLNGTKEADQQTLNDLNQRATELVLSSERDNQFREEILEAIQAIS